MEVTQVSLTLGMTLPTGKYKSARVDVSASARAAGGKAWGKPAEVELAFDKLEKILSDKMTGLLNNMMEA